MRFHRLLWFLSAGVGFVFLVTISRTVWLPWIAQNLIVEDRLRPADLIVVFAGDEGRAKHALRLYREGLAGRILVAGELTLKGTELFCHKRVTDADLNAKVLTDAGIAENAVAVIRRGTSTYEEGEIMKAFMKKNGYYSVIAVSSPYHMRRVRATLSHLLQGTRISVQYSPAHETDFSASEWWRREKDLIHVTNEYIKLAYYQLALF